MLDYSYDLHITRSAIMPSLVVSHEGLGPMTRSFRINAGKRAFRIGWLGWGWSSGVTHIRAVTTDGSKTPIRPGIESYTPPCTPRKKRNAREIRNYL